MNRTRSDGDDDALVEAAVSGDDAAFAALVTRHRCELRAHCYRMLGSMEDAEDIVQETFLRAWRKRETFAGRSRYRTWLYRIATNACIDARKRHRPNLRPLRDPIRCPPSLRVPDDDQPDARVVAKETMVLAYLAAVRLLPPKQRGVLILRDVLGYSAAETASRLDSSVAAVNSALQRARATLHEHRASGVLEAP